MRFEAFLALLAKDGARVKWHDEDVAPGNAALALRTRLEHPVENQLPRPDGFTIDVEPGCLAARLRDPAMMGRESVGTASAGYESAQTSTCADFEDLRIEFQCDSHNEWPCTSVHKVRAFALLDGTTSAPPRPVDDRSGLAMVGGAEGHAAFRAFIEAMAVVVATTIETPGTPAIGRSLKVEAETAMAMARLLVVHRQIMGKDANGDELGSLFETPYSVVQGHGRGNLAALHFALAKARPVMDPATLAWRSWAEVVEVAIPPVPASATLRARFRLEQAAAARRAKAHLASLGAPRDVVASVRP